MPGVRFTAGADQQLSSRSSRFVVIFRLQPAELPQRGRGDHTDFKPSVKTIAKKSGFLLRAKSRVNQQPRPFRRTERTELIGSISLRCHSGPSGDENRRRRKNRRRHAPGNGLRERRSEIAKECYEMQRAAPTVRIQSPQFTHRGSIGAGGQVTNSTLGIIRQIHPIVKFRQWNFIFAGQT
jgi:hypothetical protein